MSKRKEFSLLDGKLKGEIWLNDNSKKLAIFSHGFGVTRISRGMFTELAELIKEKYSVVLFDYSDVEEGGNTTTFPFSEQAEMLKTVIKHTKKIIKPEKISIIAHSQGRIIVGLVSPKNIEKIILVAGPTSAPGKSIKNYFSKRPGTKIDEKGLSKIERSDGTTTYIQSAYWKEAYEVKPEDLFCKLTKKSNVYFVKAKQDQVVTNENYDGIKNAGIKFVELDGNHDFEGKDREQWLNMMVRLLK